MPEASEIHIQRPWQVSKEELSLRLGSHLSKGLTAAEAARRLEVYGPNQLAEKQGHSWVSVLLGQFNSLIIWILIIAAVVSGFLQEWIDAAAILAIVLLNAVLGFIQEYRAEKALAALKRLADPLARAFRDGELKPVPARELVPGDLIQVEAGDNIPADGRLVTAAYFQTQEASLTGESTPLEKTGEALETAEVPLAERKNMVYMSTVAVSGKAKAIITATGMETELGKIAELLEQAAAEETPLQKRLARFGKWLVYFCLAVVLLVFFLGLARGTPFMQMFLTAVSLAVAAIPEGLPAVVTITLALGVQRMVKRHALIRRLAAVETLGSTGVICSDKTGTLTQNEMTVRRVWAGGKLFTVTGSGYSPEGSFMLEGQPVSPDSHPELYQALEIGVLCNNSGLYQNKDQRWTVVGDPTEGAILTAAAKAGLAKDKAEELCPLIFEVPFDSQRKAMSVVRRTRENHNAAFVKGAPDVILSRSSRVLSGHLARELCPADTDRITEMNERLASEALRVLAVALRPVDGMSPGTPPEEIEKDLTFVGLIGMIDPPRPEAAEAIALCKQAGIRSVMITGDHRSTAVAIARELSLLEDGQLALTGSDLDSMDDETLRTQVDRIGVYSRVSAGHKLRIVKAWKQRNAVVAMTGDGVNDAPALKEADIGVAMGITGTDVSKEVSDMVITDDNFASIVAAVEEGRTIYDNIRKFIYYLLSCNTGEIIVLFLASLFGWALPLLPIQILWTNLITDGLPALALGVDAPEPDLMVRPVRSRREGIVTREFILRMLSMGAVIGCLSLAAFAYVLFVEQEGLERARTAAFCVLVGAQLVHAFNCRSERISIFRLGFWTNPGLLLAFFASVVLQVGICYLGFAQKIFNTQPLTVRDWGLVWTLAAAPLVLMEVAKAAGAFRRRKEAQTAA